MAGQSGSVIALDPETGDVLAYLSLPGYDPNAFSAGINPQEWARADDGPREAAHQPRDPGRIPAGQHLQDHQRAGRAAGRRHHARHALPLPGLPRRLRDDLPLPQGGGPRDARPAQGASPSPATCTSTTSASGSRSSGSRSTRRCWAWPRPPASTFPTSRRASSRTRSGRCARRRCAGSPRRRSPSPSARPCPLTPVQLARVAAVVANGGRLPRPHLMKSIGGQADEHRRRPWTSASGPRWWRPCATPCWRW